MLRAALRSLTCVLPAALAGLAAQDSSAPTTAAPQPRPRIEVCFVLDTTSSMSGLIEGAKAKIWSIANQIIAAKPTPVLRIALVGYRDRGDQYVTRCFDLSDDIDAVYANLREFQAAGGGDTPESVNEALHEAVHKIAWSSDRDVLKIVFLVGDCPPHMDYPDDAKYPDTCQAAMSKDLIINTVQCGSHPGTAPVWQEIARRSEGTYAAIGQDGDMQVVATPLDKELAELNVAIGKTLIPYGDAGARRGVLAKQAVAEAAAPAASADRLAFYAGSGRTVGGRGDLIDDLAAKRVKLEDIAERDLPEELRKLPAAERPAYVAKKTAERRQVQARVAELIKQRQAYLDEQMRKLAEAGQGGAFDAHVARTLREQAGKKGIHYESPDEAAKSSPKAETNKP